MEQILNHNYRFDQLLAAIVVAVWMRLFVSFRATKMFGPIFKILIMMITDLLKFLFIWLILIVMFTSFTVLAFPKQDAFKDFDESIIYFI